MQNIFSIIKGKKSQLLQILKMLFLPQFKNFLKIQVLVLQLSSVFVEKLVLMDSVI